MKKPEELTREDLVKFMVAELSDGDFVQDFIENLAEKGTVTWTLETWREWYAGLDDEDKEYETNWLKGDQA